MQGWLHIVDRRLNPGSKSLEKPFLDDLELPDLAKRKLAEAEGEGLRRAGYSTSGSPADISVSRTVRLAMARRIALRRPRPETITRLEAEIADRDEARRVELMAELDALKAKFRRITNTCRRSLSRLISTPRRLLETETFF
jgi:uncharacterized sporulation protein YeaH/YhbH (DUF444 family)